MSEDLSKKTQFVKFETIAVGDWFLVGPDELVQVTSRNDDQIFITLPSGETSYYNKDSFWHGLVAKLVE